MKKEKIGSLNIIIIFLSFSIMFCIGYVVKQQNGICSEKRIDPVININNGDTTFIYYK